MLAYSIHMTKHGYWPRVAYADGERRSIMINDGLMTATGTRAQKLCLGFIG